MACRTVGRLRPKLGSGIGPFVSRRWLRRAPERNADDRPAGRAKNNPETDRNVSKDGLRKTQETYPKVGHCEQAICEQTVAPERPGTPHR